MKLCTCFRKRLGTQGRDFSDCYLGGTGSKRFARPRNISKLFPNAPRLPRNYLQKTLKQFGLLASKYERKSTYKSNFHRV